MSVLVDEPKRESMAAVRDLSIPLIVPDENDGIVIIHDDCGPAHEPPSELLLAAASVAVWLGLAIAVRHLLGRSRTRT
jgi:hypothetical protein